MSTWGSAGEDRAQSKQGRRLPCGLRAQLGCGLPRREALLQRNLLLGGGERERRCGRNRFHVRVSASRKRFGGPDDLVILPGVAGVHPRDALPRLLFGLALHLQREHPRVEPVPPQNLPPILTHNPKKVERKLDRSPGSHRLSQTDLPRLFQALADKVAPPW